MYARTLKQIPQSNEEEENLILEVNTVYIGQGKIIQRLNDHLLKKDWWTDGIAIVLPTTFSSASLEYIERRFIALAKSCKRFDVTNLTNGNSSNLDHQNTIICNEIINDLMKVVFHLGCQVFVPLVVDDPLGSRIFKITTPQSPEGSTRHADATMKVLIFNDKITGYQVQSGSKVTKGITGSTLRKNFPHKLWDSLLSDNIIIDRGDYFEFAQSYTFESPSTASNIVLRSITDGHGKWKDEESGRPLRSYL